MESESEHETLRAHRAVGGAATALSARRNGRELREVPVAVDTTIDELLVD